jgi:mRNA interferase RelE/StbE
MISYQILWKQSSEKDLKKIGPDYRDRIINAIAKLSKEPIPHNSCKLKTTENYYRIRVGRYRIIYYIDGDKNNILIYYIRHRKDAYR